MDPNALPRQVADYIRLALDSSVELDIEDLTALLQRPPQPEFGDLAMPCFRMAEAMRKAPAKIASQFAEKLTPGNRLVAQVSAVGPYLNFKLHPHEAARHLLTPWCRGEQPTYPCFGQKIMVEYSQPNTHKAFHVGHMRNVCLGDSLVRLLRATGHDVVAANYLGDVGTHVAKCLWGLEALAEGEPSAETRGEWLGQIYARAAIRLEDWERSVQAGDETAAAEYARARQRMSEILRGIETRESHYLDLWSRTRRWSTEDFDEIYRWAGVNFDRVYSESEVDSPGLALVEEYLDKGVFVESGGAVGIYNREVEHMPFFMLRKSDGTGLYATKDLALARMKMNEYRLDRSIYVVDARQSDHFKHVFLTITKMGLVGNNCEHVAYGMVELPDGPMSSREGNVILFRALREQLATALDANYFHALRGQWPDDEIQAVLHQVSLGAIKYGMLARDNNQKIVFDMDEWTNVHGNSGPYLQYVGARSASLLRKAAARGLVLDPALLSGQRAPEPGTLSSMSERLLMHTLIDLPRSVIQAANSLRPSILCGQLHGLAKAYNRFQQDCNVIHQKDVGVAQARLMLVKATSEALRWGLSLLGIPTPERM